MLNMKGIATLRNLLIQKFYNENIINQMANDLKTALGCNVEFNANEYSFKIIFDNSCIIKKENITLMELNSMYPIFNDIIMKTLYSHRSSIDNIIENYITQNPAKYENEYLEFDSNSIFKYLNMMYNLTIVGSDIVFLKL